MIPRVLFFSFFICIIIIFIFIFIFLFFEIKVVSEKLPLFDSFSLFIIIFLN